MKKIITLVAVTLFVSTSFAQYNDDDNRIDNDKRRDAIYRSEDRHNDNDRLYVYNNRQREREIARINWEYDDRIESVKHRWFLSRSRKEEIICRLEENRRRDIRMIYEKYNDRRDRWDDHDYHHHDRNW